MEFILILVLLAILCRIGFAVTGALLSMAVWVVVRLPLALIVYATGVGLCVTILLFPLGLKCFKLGTKILLG